jgi:hypothetical protein
LTPGVFCSNIPAGSMKKNGGRMRKLPHVRHISAWGSVPRIDRSDSNPVPQSGFSGGHEDERVFGGGTLGSMFRQQEPPKRKKKQKKGLTKTKKLRPNKSKKK